MTPESRTSWESKPPQSVLQTWLEASTAWSLCPVDPGNGAARMPASPTDQPPTAAVRLVFGTQRQRGSPITPNAQSLLTAQSADVATTVRRSGY